MRDVSFDMSSIGKEFENLILTSKLYLNNREQEKLSILKNNIDILNLEMEQAFSGSKESLDPQALMALRELTKIVGKFNTTVQLFTGIRSEKPLHRQIDVRTILDILLDNVKLLCHSEKSANTDKLESDLQAIESIEEQHKRILITYLMQDWKNLKEVLTLIKVGEIYKEIAEKLIDVSLLMNHPEKH